MCQKILIIRNKMQTPVEIISGLFVGDQSTCDVKTLNKHKITTVISANEDTFELPKKYLHLHLYWDSNPRIFPDMDNAYNIINDALWDDKNVLVYSEPIPRAVAVVVFFMMRRFDIRYKKALKEVKHYIPDAVIDHNIAEQLIEWDRFKKSKVQLIFDV